VHVLFVEPCFPSYQMKFVHALAEVGARVTGIGERPIHALPQSTKSHLHRYEQVGNVCDETQLFQAVRRCQEREWVDRLEATIEAHILPVAKVRKACSIPGTSVRTAFLCRDKPAMKQVLREAGIPCAQSTGASSPREIREFAKAVGFPIIVKPTDAAGAAGTYRVHDATSLKQAIQACGVTQGQVVAVEEFIEGHEGFYDTVSIEGQVAHEFMSHYYPNVLEGMRQRWISPQVLTTNRIDAPDYGEVRQLASKVHKVLGIGTSATHMEWFFGPKGLKFSEIGCRPPGVGMWDLYCAANDMDLYKEWAMAIVHGQASQKASRQYAAGMIALRPDRDGRIQHVEGLDVVQHSFHQWIIDSHFPSAGTPTQPIEGGFWANGWMRLRHPDYDRLREILNFIGERIQLRAQA